MFHVYTFRLSRTLLGPLLAGALGLASVSGQSDSQAGSLDYLPPAYAALVAEQLPGAEVLAGGVRFLERKTGEGPFIQEGDRVEAVYEGRLLDGTVFNRKTGDFHTYRFTVGAEPRQVIRGWEMAMPRMQAGGKYTVAIPAEFAYRDKGRAGQVPPYATVVFDIEILAVQRPAP